MNKLVDYILDGEADKLRDRSSDDEEVQELINGVPKFEVHLTLFLKKFPKLLFNFISSLCLFYILLS